MGVTAIKQIYNNSPQTIRVNNHENPPNSVTINPNTNVSFDIWIPWCTSQSDWQGNRYLSLDRADGSVDCWIWQQDNNVRYGTDGQFHDNGAYIPGVSQVDGDRVLWINPDGSVALTVGSIMLGDYRAYADAAVAALMADYNGSGQWNSVWFGGAWWNFANALEAVIDYSRRTGSTAYLGDIATTFDKNDGSNFINNYYDDEGWWALAWIKAYDLTNDARYLSMARTIFDDMLTGWYPNTCGGGLRWRKKDDTFGSPTYGQVDYGKGAIQNELFLTVAARLYRRIRPVDASLLNWALEEWTWFSSPPTVNGQKVIGMINGHNLINNGLKADCNSAADTTWTYNQGVILGGLVELFKITGNRSYLQEAQNIADAVLTATTARVDANNIPSDILAVNGILTEPGQPGFMNNNYPQFKGIFMRNLSYLYEADPTQGQYKNFMIANANSIWLYNRTPDNKFGVNWSGPVDSTDFIRQTSALDAFNAAIPFAWNASYVSQAIPGAMVGGNSYAVSVTMRNTGTTTWTSGNGTPPVRLGTQNPQDNTTWSLNREGVPAAVMPGSNVTFNAVIRAPSSPGTYNMQWRMVEEGVTWFGDTTPNVQVSVSKGKETKDTKEGKDHKEKEGDKLAMREKVTDTGTATRPPSTNGPAQSTLRTGGLAATGTAFIAPDERPAVGGRALMSSEEGGMTPRWLPTAIPTIKRLSPARPRLWSSGEDGFPARLSLKCHNMNRPSPTCLSGPYWWQEYWVSKAALLGSPCVLYNAALPYPKKAGRHRRRRIASP